MSSPVLGENQKKEILTTKSFLDGEKRETRIEPALPLGSLLEQYRQALGPAESKDCTSSRSHPNAAPPVCASQHAVRFGPVRFLRNDFLTDTAVWALCKHAHPRCRSSLEMLLQRWPQVVCVMFLPLRGGQAWGWGMAWTFPVWSLQYQLSGCHPWYLSMLRKSTSPLTQVTDSIFVNNFANGHFAEICTLKSHPDQIQGSVKITPAASALASAVLGRGFRHAVESPRHLSASQYCC